MYVVGGTRRYRASLGRHCQRDGVTHSARGFRVLSGWNCVCFGGRTFDDTRLGIFGGNQRPERFRIDRSVERQHRQQCWARQLCGPLGPSDEPAPGEWKHLNWWSVHPFPIGGWRVAIVCPGLCD